MACVAPETQERTLATQERFTLHRTRPNDPLLDELARHSDVLVVYPGFSHVEAVRDAVAPIAFIGKRRDIAAQRGIRSLAVENEDDPKLLAFCLDPKPDLPT